MFVHLSIGRPNGGEMGRETHPAGKKTVCEQRGQAWGPESNMPLPFQHIHVFLRVCVRVRARTHVPVPTLPFKGSSSLANVHGSIPAEHWHDEKL